MSTFAHTNGHNLVPLIEQQALRIELLRAQIAGVEAVRSTLEREEAKRPPRKQLQALEPAGVGR